MDNKGFTLVEVLATIVILGVVMGIASYGVLNVIKTSKEKSEKIFLDKLGETIETYIKQNKFNFEFEDSEAGSFTKCRMVKDDGSCFEEDPEQVSFSKIKTPIKLKTIQDSNLINNNIIINPKNKLECISTEINPEIDIYRDEDMVYYYYVNMSNSACEVDENNKNVTNIPQNLCNSLSEYNYNESLKVCEKNA